MFGLSVTLDNQSTIKDEKKTENIYPEAKDFYFFSNKYLLQTPDRWSE